MSIILTVMRLLSYLYIQTRLYVHEVMSRIVAKKVKVQGTCNKIQVMMKEER